MRTLEEAPAIGIVLRNNELFEEETDNYVNLNVFLKIYDYISGNFCSFQVVEEENRIPISKEIYFGHIVGKVWGNDCALLYPSPLRLKEKGDDLIPQIVELKKGSEVLGDKHILDKLDEIFKEYGIDDYIEQFGLEKYVSRFSAKIKS